MEEIITSEKKERFGIKNVHTGEELGLSNNNDYSCSGNTIRNALEEKMAVLECGKYSLCFPSGMAAINNVLTLLNSGDHIVSESSLYNGAIRRFTKLYSKFNIDFSFIDCIKLENIERAIRKNTKLFWIETPTNPFLRIIDIKEIAKITREHNILLVVDNTFTTPYLQQPLLFGADIVIHCTTKYWGGYSDIDSGAIITSNKRIYNKLTFFQNITGAIPCQFDSWLLSRSIKTLNLRMKQHCENAREIAKFLYYHPKIETVYYPGLPNHPQHSLAKKQMKDFGGIISFELKGENNSVKEFLKSLKIFSIANNLGSTDSLVAHPATMNDGTFPKNERIKVNFSDRLIRLSIGLEDANELIEDLNFGLGKNN